VMGKVTKVEMTFFIAVEGGSQAVWGGWLATVVRVQYFCFSSRGGQCDQALPKDKRRQRSRLGSKGRKCDTMQWNGDVG
jgi:hypothetical protein